MDMGKAFFVFAAAACLAAHSHAAPQNAAETVNPPADLIVLHCGSDWCVSGENVRKTFESRAFRAGISAECIVFDDMDAPPPEVKKRNDALRKTVPDTQRYPAVTCVARSPSRLYARFENLPRGIEAAKLRKLADDAAKVKAKAVELFAKGAKFRERGLEQEAANAYGKGFAALEAQVGDRDVELLRKGAFAWKEEWAALCELDKDDRYGWKFRFEAGKALWAVEKASGFRRKGDFKGGEAFVSALRAIPQRHMTVEQRQAVDIAEYSLWRDAKDAARREANAKLLDHALSLGRDTFWGQCALGFIVRGGKKMPLRERYRAPVRPRPREGTMLAKLPDTAAPPSKRNGGWSEADKLAIVRADVFAKAGADALRKLAARPGSAVFAKAFFNNRGWMEDFAWSGPADWPKALLALESLHWQDDGRWIDRDAAGRRCATAMALQCSARDEAFLADFLDAFRETWREGRLHKKALSQNVWTWRYAMGLAHPQCHCDDPPNTLRYLQRFVNMPAARYAKAHWIVPYRSNNCFGVSVHTPDYYQPWRTAGEWAQRKYSYIVGGVCGELSKFGATCSNVHGLPATTAGQPQHCAYTRRSPDGRWSIENYVYSPTDVHLRLWNDGAWTMLHAYNDTFEGDREKRLDAERFAAVARAAERAKEAPEKVAALYKAATAAWPRNYGVRLECCEWMARTARPLGEMRAFALECAKTLPDWRKPLWNLLTPYFSRVAGELGPAALADDFAAFAPLLRQSGKKLQEEADFRRMFGVWTAPVAKDKAAVAKMLKACLFAQHGTPDYFSQMLAWGCDTMMKDDGAFAQFAGVIEDLGKAKGALDFGTLLKGAEQNRNLRAFRRICSLQDALAPHNGKGVPYPQKDFGGVLLSSGGMIYGSSSCGRDKAALHPRCIDDSPRAGMRFTTNRETGPAATVVLAGAAEITGIVVASGAAGGRNGSLAPLEILVSEDGKDWRVVHTESEAKDIYRIDLAKEAPRAVHVRARRKPGAANNFFPLDKFLIYGRKLY